MKKLEEKAN